MASQSPLEDVLRRHIENARGSRIQYRQKESAFGPMVADWMFRDEKENMHFLEVVGGTPTLRNLAILSLLRDYHDEHSDRPWGKGQPGYWLAAKSFPSVVKQVARDIDIGIIPIPQGVPVTTRSTLPGKLRITSPQAWRLLYHLLMEPAASINALSRDAGVSYGWTHHLVTALLDQGVLKQEGGIIEVVEERLLDLVAWERPLKKFRIRMFRCDQLDVGFLARALVDDIGDQAGFAFTGPAVSSWRTGAHKAGGRLDLYLPEPERIDGMLEPGEGVTVNVYKSDRELIVQPLDGMPVVGERQLVLDLAGLGATYQDHIRSLLDHARSEFRQA